MLLGVTAGLAQGAGVGHVFLVGLPGQPGSIQTSGEVGLVDKALGAVGVDAEGAAADQGEIVGQAGMADGIVLGEQGIVLGEAVEGGGMPIAGVDAADDLVEAAVFEHDQDDMVEDRHTVEAYGRRRGGQGGGCGRIDGGGRGGGRRA